MTMPSTSTVGAAPDLVSDEVAGPSHVQPTSRWASAGRELHRLAAPKENLTRLVVFALLMGAWELTGRWLIDQKWISSPPSVGERLWDTLRDGTMIDNATYTLQSAAYGLAIGTVLGLVGGVIVGNAPRLAKRALDPFILAAWSTPRIALAPFFVVWFGIGLTSKVALVVTVVGFIVYFNVRQGVEEANVDLVDAMRSMRATRWQMIRYLTVPGLVTWLLAAIRIGVGMAVVSAVVGEISGSTKGLGNYMSRSLHLFDITGAVTAMIVMALVSVILYVFVSALERRVSGRRNATGFDAAATTKL